MFKRPIEGPDFREYIGDYYREVEEQIRDGRIAAGQYGSVEMREDALQSLRESDRYAAALYESEAMERARMKQRVKNIMALIEAEEGPYTVGGHYFASGFDAELQRKRLAEIQVRDEDRKARWLARGGQVS